MVDTSETGIGAKLSQLQDNQWRLLACINRALTPAEKKWTVHEREALGIIWSLEKLKSYLYSSKFTIQTDHRNLMWLLRLTEDKGRLSRWGTIMSQWNITMKTDASMEASRQLEHIPGSKMAGPDCLSRVHDIKDGGSSPPQAKEDLILMVKSGLGLASLRDQSGSQSAPAVMPILKMEENDDQPMDVGPVEMGHPSGQMNPVPVEMGDSPQKDPVPVEMGGPTGQKDPVGNRTPTYAEIGIAQKYDDF